jgi:hypothetical protein
MKWYLLYLVLSSDVNHNWFVKEMSQEMPSQIVCLRTAANLKKMTTLRRQFLDVRCEELPQLVVDDTTS